MVSYSNSGCEYVSAIATSWAGVNQSSPFGTAAMSANTSLAGTQSLTVSNTNSTDIILSSLTDDNGALMTFALPTTYINRALGNGMSIWNAQTPASDTSTAVSFTNSTYSDWSLIAIPLHTN